MARSWISNSKTEGPTPLINKENAAVTIQRMNIDKASAPSGIVSEM